MATTDSIYSLGTTVDGENLELSLVQSLGAADTPLCTTLCQNYVSLVWELELGGYRTTISGALNQNNLTITRYTNSTVALGTTADGENLELAFVWSMGTCDTPICTTLCQSTLFLVWELSLGGHRTNISDILNESGNDLTRLTDSILPLGTTAPGENLEWFFIASFTGYSTPICTMLCQAGIVVLWIGIGGHVTPVCATYNEFIGSAWAQAMDWGQDMEWVTTEWLPLLLQTNFGGFTIQNLGGISSPVNIGGVDE